MENNLHVRDRVGVQDFVLLEEFQSENAFLENMRKRFKENLIYTYIGPVLVSVNPYRNLDIYTKTYIKQYQNVNFYELPPHIFAITDTAYRSMRDEVADHCILISGESGAGKTEASKKILLFLAAASHNSPTVESVKDKLLKSNPVLEAFGNAKTNRNDNSSRFGKYMDIEFNFMGDPVGGHILNYLLEKSRVVYQASGERNFHVFYQLLGGADNDVLERLQLRRDPGYYYYLNQGDSTQVESIDDAANFQTIELALSTINFTEAEKEALYSIVACVLHMGNIGYLEKDGSAVIAQTKPVLAICKLLDCDEDAMLAALTKRSIEAKGEKLGTDLTRDQAIHVRDAWAKAIYERMFKWLVQKLNLSLNANKAKGRKTLMGILDIYGFEIFGQNSFEQFCINYCNEKLQQLFIQLTLKSEQEEYQREGIEWEPVEFFNNKIICDLVEERHKGIIAIMDEECLRPGNVTDKTFLTKLENVLRDHKHFIAHGTADNKMRKQLLRDEFRLVHYAGDVTYKIEGFLDKNNDLLYRDIKEVMSKSKNVITKESFPASELDSKKMPVTAATQFKNSLAELMVILMSKEPSYVRCVKPNDEKRPAQFDDTIVRHQVKYLGLMENLRVRRAGFAYRRPYEVFLKRYKSLCPRTWPSYRGSAREGVAILVHHLGYLKDDFRMGKTKLFIRLPRTLFKTEDAFQHRKHGLASLIQATYKAVLQRRKYEKMRNAVTVIAKYWRRHVAQLLLERRRHAAKVIRSFIKGYITRNDAPNECNSRFVKISRRNYLNRLSHDLPKSVLDKNWMPPPKCCQETSRLLHKLHTKNQVRAYIKSLTPERMHLFQEKVVAEELFKGKKQSYLKSVPKHFSEVRLSAEDVSFVKTNFENSMKSPCEKTLGYADQYCCHAIKYDRHGYKQRERILVVTTGAVYLLDPRETRAKHRLGFNDLQSLIVSSLTDNVLVIRIPLELKKDKGDLILTCDFLIEVIVKLVMATKKKELLNIDTSPCILHSLSSGKQGTIEISTGYPASVAKGKNGNLVVVALAP